MPLAAAAGALVGAVGGAGAAASIGSGLLGAGVSIYQSSQAKKANKQALQAQQQAQQQQLQAQQQNFDRITQLNQPFIAGGQQGFDAVIRELLGAGAIHGGRAPAGAMSYSGGQKSGTIVEPAYRGEKGQPGYGSAQMQPVMVDKNRPEIGTQSAVGGPDWASYGAQNPDLQAEWQRLQSTGEADTRFGGDPENFLQFHYQNYGQQEGRPLPQAQAQPQQGFEGDQPPTGPQYPDWADPNAPPTFARPSGPIAPNLGSYFTNFEADPSYQFRLSEGLKGVNAASAVRGKLRSGDAAKALARYSSDLASTEYGNWFNRGLQRANLDQNAYQFDARRNDQNFLDDRSYRTNLWDAGVNRADNRYDTRINNLFRIAGIGQGAAGAVAGAGTNFANAASDIYGAGGDARANAAYGNAQANAYGAAGIGSAIQGIFNRFGSAGGGGFGVNSNTAIGSGYRTPIGVY